MDDSTASAKTFLVSKWGTIERQATLRNNMKPLGVSGGPKEKKKDHGNGKYFVM